MAIRNSQKTGWQYISGSPVSCDNDFLLKPDLRRAVIKVDVPVDPTEDELIENAISIEGPSSQYDRQSFSAESESHQWSPQSSNFSPCAVLRELPSRQINFSQPDLTDERTDRRPNQCKHKRQKQTFGTSSSHAKKAMMTRGRDVLNAKEVVGSILKNPNLNQAGLEADSIRMETLRELNCSLTMKRNMKRRIGQELYNKQRPSVFKSPTLTFKITQVYKIVKTFSKQVLSGFDMWRSQLTHIEGKYGSSTTYYFRFLKFLIALNLICFLFTASFIVIPQLLLRLHGQYHYSNESYTMTSTELTPSHMLKRSIDTYRLTNDEIDNDTVQFQWSDLITGAGFLSTTELYYGTYVNFSISLVGNDYYDLPLAYLLVTIICLFIGLLALVTKVGRSYKQHIIINSGFGVHVYCNLVFCSWDFTIRSKKTAKLKCLGIKQEMEVKLIGLKNDANPMNSKEKCQKYSTHLFIHLVVLIMLAGTATLIWFLLENNSLVTGMAILDDMIVPIVITILLIILPFTFTLLVSWEKYTNETNAIYVNMIRLMLLLVTVIGILCYFWFRTNANETVSIAANNCWETRLGEEIYKLLLVDLVIVNTVSFLASFFQMCFLQRLIGPPEFNLAWNTWNLIYTQMLGWLGALYMPPVSGLVIVKLLITYYIKQVHIRLICAPSARPWGATLTKTVFLSLALIGLISMLIPIGYSIFVMTPSPVCGPFKETVNIYSVLNGIVIAFSMMDSIVAFFVNLVSMPGVVAALLVILCAIAFQAKSYAKSTKQLRERIRRQEGNDKVFLLNMIDVATKSLESKRKCRCSEEKSSEFYERRIFNFPLKVKNSVSDKRKNNLSKSDKSLAVQFEIDMHTLNKTNTPDVKSRQDFGSSSTEQSFVTCEPPSPNTTMNRNSIFNQKSSSSENVDI